MIYNITLTCEGMILWPSCHLCDRIAWQQLYNLRGDGNLIIFYVQPLVDFQYFVRLACCRL